MWSRLNHTLKISHWHAGVSRKYFYHFKYEESFENSKWVGGKDLKASMNMHTSFSIPRLLGQHPTSLSQRYARKWEEPTRRTKKHRSSFRHLSWQMELHDDNHYQKNRIKASEQPHCQRCFICPLSGIKNGSLRNCSSQMRSCLWSSAYLSLIQDWVNHLAWC